MTKNTEIKKTPKRNFLFDVKFDKNKTKEERNTEKKYLNRYLKGCKYFVVWEPIAIEGIIKQIPKNKAMLEAWN